MISRIPSVTGVLRTVNLAADHLPALTVTFAPHCDGAAWLVDPDTDSVYVDGTVTPDAAAIALTDAVTVLCRIRGVPAPHLDTRRTLQLLRGGLHPGGPDTLTLASPPRQDIHPTHAAQ